MLRADGWRRFLQWFGVVQSAWRSRTGVSKPLLRRKRSWALATSAGMNSAASRLRGLLFEPLESRQVLTAGLGFASTPFSVDPSTQNLTVHYELSTAATAAFSIALYADDGVSPDLLVSESVTNPSLWTVGSHSFTMSAPFSAEPKEDYRLNVVLDPGDADVTEEFTGVFLEDSGIVELFGTTSGDNVEIATAAGSQIRVTLNSVDYFFDDADVSDLHLRTGDGNDVVSFADEVDVPLWAFGGDGDDELESSGAASYLNGGADRDNFYSFVTAPLEVDGGAGEEDVLNVNGSSGIDFFFAFDDTMTMNGNTIDSSNAEAIVIALGDGNDFGGGEETVFTDAGFIVVAINGSNGADSIGLGGPESGSGTGLLGVYLLGGDGDDNLSYLPQNLSRPAGSFLYLLGQDGNDELYLAQYGSAMPSDMVVSLNGGAGTDSLELSQLASANTTISSSAISPLGYAVLGLDSLESLDVSTEGGFASTVTVLGTVPTLNLVGDAGDQVVMSSTPGGSIASTTSPYSVSSTTFAIDGPGTDITTVGFTSFSLDAANITIDGITLNQNYVVANSSTTAPQLTLTGSVVVPSGFSTSDHRQLIQNTANATLHGGFLNDHAIMLSGVMYSVEYVSDVYLDSMDYSGGNQVTVSHIVTHNDKIPRFVNGWMEPDASDVNRSITSGDWSSSSTWSLGHVPTDGELVRILPGTVVSYDVVNDTDAIHAIEVLGSLVFVTDADTHLLVGTLQVMPGGTLEIGSTTTPISSSHTATVEFADEADDATLDPSQYGTGMIVFGTVSIHGAAVGTLGDEAGESQTWLRLAQEPLTDDIELVLSVAAPSGWNIGDQLVLPDTRQVLSDWDKRLTLAGEISAPVARETEVVTIYGFSPDRKTIYLTDPITEEGSPVLYDHKGAYSYDYNELTESYDATLELYPHVALLNRNVLLVSENPDGYRGHTMYGGRADVDIRYAQFQDLGRTSAYDELDNTTYTPEGTVEHLGTNQIGRYAAHFHHDYGPINPTNTGYQFVFAGNALNDSLKWPVAVHDTSFGLVADNVVYNAEGSGFITEDGSELGNLFLNNMTVAVYGTYNDGKDGLDPGSDQSKNDHARGGVGFWFRRTGNDFIGNVSADNSYGGIVITSYYLFGQVKLPNYRGASTHVAGQFTPTYNNPSGVISDNEVYGMGRVGMWLTYASGNSQREEYTDEVVFENLTMWNAAIGDFIALYHVTNITFDNLVILGDINSLTRLDWGTRGISMLNYESQNVQILNSRIEGLFTGIRNTAATTSVPGGDTYTTLVENTILHNYINVEAYYATDNRGHGTRLDLVDDLFSMFETLPNADPVNLNTKLPKNISMGSMGSTGNNFAQLSIVRVFGYNQDPDDNFQVYFNDQGADSLMHNSLANWYVRGDGTVGAPPDSYLTNQQAWDTYRIANGGFVAPSTATASRPEIDGLVGLVDEFIDPSTWDPKVVIITPWDDVSFIQPDYGSPYVYVRFRVEGQIPVGGEMRFDYDDGEATAKHYHGAIPDGIIWNATLGTHTLRGYIVDSYGVEIANSSTEVTFEILGEQVQDVTLAPFPINQPTVDYFWVDQLVIAAGGEFLLGAGIAITGISGVQGEWEYLNGSGYWTAIPSTVDETSALLLGVSSRVRFKVSPTYTYSALDAAPTLEFYSWMTKGSKTTYSTVDITSDGDFDTRLVTVTQPLLDEV